MEGIKHVRVPRKERRRKIEKRGEQNEKKVKKVKKENKVIKEKVGKIEKRKRQIISNNVNVNDDKLIDASNVKFSSLKANSSSKATSSRSQVAQAFSVVNHLDCTSSQAFSDASMHTENNSEFNFTAECNGLMGSLTTHVLDTASGVYTLKALFVLIPNFLSPDRIQPGE